MEGSFFCSLKVIFMAVLTKIILVCFLSLQCHSFASGPVFEANTFDTGQREGAAVCTQSLTERCSLPRSTLTLPAAGGELS